jgi:hypothetical protein
MERKISFQTRQRFVVVVGAHVFLHARISFKQQDADPILSVPNLLEKFYGPGRYVLTIITYFYFLFFFFF